MFKFIFVPFAIFLLILIFAGSILQVIIRLFISKNKKQGGNNKHKTPRNKENLAPTDAQKRFSEDVGEYVNYEDIKEE